MKQPLVSIIVPTKNSAPFLAACLQSIKNQTYPHIELIVVDNHSQDDTLAIAKQHTNLVFTRGPERCAQRNYGAQQSHGDYLLFIDSDMELEPQVVEQCVEKVQHSQAKGVIIPEASFGEGFWAQCKRLEKSLYVGVEWIEAARFYDRHAFEQVGGWDESMVSGEDWDLSQRIKNRYRIDRITTFIKHNEGHLSLIQTVKKKYHYAKQLRQYTRHAHQEKAKQMNPLSRYLVLLRQPSKLLQQPFLALGLFFMKTTELLFGGVGYIANKSA